MKKLLTFTLVFALAITLGYGVALADKPQKDNEYVGSGAPSGAHYNLNLLGKTNCPGDDLKDTNRHTIMVLLNFSDADADNILGDDPGNIVTLDKRNKIFLAPGDDFQVTDGNACDGDGAGFTLPANVATAWEVYIRELGKPGGSGDIRTCGIDEGPDGIAGTNDDEVVCSSENVLLVRDTGRSKFRNVTKELTTMVIQVYDVEEEEWVTIRINLFDPMLYQYFWDYDNNGLRLVQLRFYPL